MHFSKGKHVSNNYAPYFNRINFAVIPSHIELPCYNISSGNKILSSLIKKVWCICNFLNYFKEANE